MMSFRVVLKWRHSLKGIGSKILWLQHKSLNTRERDDWDRKIMQNCVTSFMDVIYNILRSTFLYTSVLRSFSLDTVFVSKILTQKLLIKCWWNWLPTYSTYVATVVWKSRIVFWLFQVHHLCINFNNILCAPFSC